MEPRARERVHRGKESIPHPIDLICDLSALKNEDKRISVRSAAAKWETAKPTDGRAAGVPPSSLYLLLPEEPTLGRVPEREPWNNDG